MQSPTKEGSSLLLKAYFFGSKTLNALRIKPSFSMGKIEVTKMFERASSHVGLNNLLTKVKNFLTNCYKESTQNR
jgi:hypothetical protein